MKNIRGIYQDSDPIDTPEGFAFFLKNAILTEKQGAIENEPGNVKKWDFQAKETNPANFSRRAIVITSIGGERYIEVEFQNGTPLEELPKAGDLITPANFPVGNIPFNTPKDAIVSPTNPDRAFIYTDPLATNPNGVLQVPPYSTVNYVAQQTTITGSFLVIGVRPLNNGDTLFFLVEPQTSLSAIVLIDSNNNEKVVLDDTQIADGNLEFNQNFPIDSEFYIDYKGERIVAFIDDLNTPRILNVDRDYTINPITIVDLELFSKARFDCLSISLNYSGGAVKSGSYAFAYRYKDLDGSFTGWSVISNSVPVTTEGINPITGYVGSKGDFTTGKSISVTLNKPDINYDRVEFAVLKSINSIISAASFTEVSVGSGPLTVTYAGSGSETDLLLEEVLTPTISYKNAKAITQLNNRLYLGNLEAESEVDYIEAASLINLKWESELITIGQGVGALGGNTQAAERTTFMPGEVYAFFIQWQRAKDGSWTKGYHIPGRAATGNEKDIVNVPNSAGTVSAENYLRYQVEDTVANVSGTNDIRRGDFSYWENMDEAYSATGPIVTKNKPVSVIPVSVGASGFTYRVRVADLVAFGGTPPAGDLGDYVLNGASNFFWSVPPGGVFGTTYTIQTKTEVFDQGERYIQLTFASPVNLLTGSSFQYGENWNGASIPGGGPLITNGVIGTVESTPINIFEDKLTINEPITALEEIPEVGDTVVLTGLVQGNGTFLVTAVTGSTPAGQTYIETNSPTDPEGSGTIQFQKQLFGGGALTGNVRHHKFPSSGKLLELYGINPGIPPLVPAGTVEQYGHDKIAQLKVRAENVTVPANLAEEFVGYRILYAKRDLSNATVISQSLINYSGVQNVNPPGGGAITYWPSCGMDIDSGVNADFEIRGIYPGALLNIGWGTDGSIPSRYIRFHGFNLLLDKPAVSPDLVKLEYKLNTTPAINNGTLPSVFSGGNADYGKTGKWKYNFFNFNAGTFNNGYLEAPTIRNNTIADIMPVESKGYVPNGGIAAVDGDTIYNVAGEEHLLLKNLDTSKFNIVSRGYQSPGATSSYVAGTTAAEGAACRKEVGTLLSIKRNVYSPYIQSELVPVDQCYIDPNLEAIPEITGVFPSVLPAQVFRGGDSFAALHCINMTAPIDINAVLNTDHGNGTGDPDGPDQGQGSKVTVFLPVYSPKNENFRYNDPADPQSEFHSKSLINNVLGAAGAQDQVYLGRQSVAEPHVFLYNEDHSLRLPAETNIYPPYDPLVVVDNNFPNQVARSIEQDPQQNTLNWKVFLTQDVYTMPRRPGQITNLQGVGNQRLYIHLENSLFITKDRTTLKGDIQSVTLGAGDIFDVPPFEVLSTEDGYAGTQHKFACVLTKAGYVFPDASRGKLFIHNGQQLDEISKKGLRIFFRDNINKSLPDNPFIGQGMTITYDERFNRLLITHKDIINEQSWTISYSPQLEAFASFHDYIPDFLYSQQGNKVFSVQNVAEANRISAKLLEQNVGEFSKFYGVGGVPIEEVYPMIVDIVYNPEPYETKIFSNVRWVTEAIDPATGESLKDETFNFITLRNDTKASGRMELEKLVNIYNTSGQNLRNTETTWNFNNFRNIVRPGNPFLTDFYSNYNLEPTGLNPNTAWYNKSRFIDNYTICRFEYNNLLNYRFRLLDSVMLYRRSIR